LRIASVHARNVRGKAGNLQHGRAPSAGLNNLGLRERKKARLRQQIVDTAICLFRERGYENTRVDDIVQVLEISQPTFFRYFPSKDAVLRDVAMRGVECVKDQLRAGLSTDSTTAERLRKSYGTMARYAEADRPLWQAVVLSGAMDPVLSREMRQQDETAVALLREVLAEGQKRGEITDEIPIVHLAQFMGALYRTVVRHWAVDITGPYKLTDRVRSAVDFFLRGARP
jgi:AcrR family transcriptional regulator